MLFEKSYCMFDFQRKLIRFQFFPGDSCQTKTSDVKDQFYGITAYARGAIWTRRATIRGMPSTKITVQNNGSIRIEGDFEILDPAGNAFGLAGRSVIALCRCGQSGNKPFCDGSHNRTGFSDTVTARELPPPKPKV